MTRRSVLIAAGVCVAAPRLSEGSALSIARELRRMVGFHVLAADDVTQAYRMDNGERIIHLRGLGLFRQRVGGGTLAPIASSEAIVFAKPYAAHLRRQFPGLPERAYFDYRLLIGGEFYHVEAFD